jgi:acetylornithine deacetylase/succinyl-diaminopimelate desuccinylase-like protein
MATPTLDFFKEYFAQHRSTIEKTYVEFLRFPSVSADPAALPHVQACARWLADRLKARGCSVELWEENGYPIVFGSLRSSNPNAPTVLIYHHYDVQPVDPIDEWTSDPFQARIEGQTVYARGAQDNKGQCLYTLCALEALTQLDHLPCHLKFVFEGEEESGSASLIKILPQRREQLKADYALILDSGMRQAQTPAVSLGTRGLTALTVTVTGTKQDLHSGVLGGLAYNPLHALVALLASLRNPDGSIAIPGFYDQVRMPSSEETSHLALTFDEKEFEREYGQPATGGEAAYPPLVRNWLRPTLEINGVHGGYGGAGNKTVIPREALAKISCRLVPDQDPETIAQLVKSFILSHAPRGVTVDVKIHEGGGRATRASDTAPGFKALERAIKTVWNRTPERIFDGASIPIIAYIGEASGAEVITWGVGLPSDLIHAPNEHFDLTRVERGFCTLCLAIIEMGRK